MNHANHHHAVLMLNVKKEMELELAVVYQIIMETLTLDAGQNVYRIQIAIAPRHVSQTNAKTLVLEYVGSMLNVEYKIMLLYAYACWGTKETRQEVAI